MDDWLVIDDQNLSNDEEEVTICSPMDPSDLVITLSSSDEREEDEDYYDVFDDPPDVNSRMERINQIAHLVLPYLPARTLVRFRSASPSFNRLISGPLIVRNHFLHPRALSGLFYHQQDDAIRYLSLDAPCTNLPDPTLSYLPEPVTIKASTHGLLCVRGQHSLKFYVTNPITMEWVELPPEPHLDECNEVAVVIVFDQPSVFNFNCDYRVVCAYQIFQGLYYFMTFSSHNWAWTRSDEPCDQVDKIVAESGTAVGAVAYWRTTLHFILSYDPVNDRINRMARPHTELEEVWWELGEMNGQLSVTSQSNAKEILVSTMEATRDGEDPWNEQANFWLFDALVTPIRSQGLAKLIFWEEKSNERGLVLRDMDGQQVCSFQEPTYNYGFFPYISTLVPVTVRRE